MGQRAVPALAGGVRRGKPEVAQRCAAVLGLVGGEDAWRCLIDALRSPDPLLQRFAASNLQCPIPPTLMPREHREEAVTELLRIVQQQWDGDADLWSAAEEALAGFDDPRCFGVWRRLIRSPNWGRRGPGVSAAGWSSDLRLIPLLEAALHTTDDKVERAVIARAIEYVKENAARKQRRGE